MALENDDLIVVQKSGGGELRKAKISDIKPDAPNLQLTAELVFSAENNADVEWDTTVRALATVTGGAQPVALTYQWWNDFGLIISDTAIAGATSATYKIPETKVGYSIWCVVKATDADGIEVEADTNKCVVTEKAVAAELWTEDSGNLYPTTLTNNVGIGTDSPVNRLHVAGNIQQETGQAIFSNHYYNGEWKAIDESKPGGYINLCDNDGKLVLGNGPGDEPPTQKLVILQSGNTGIGTDSPASKLHVKGSGDATSTNVVPSEYTANIQTDTAFLSIGSENGRPCLQSSGAGTGYHLLLNPFQGNVGIGIP